ncbi:hypothetical protein [Spirosoma areae]
MNKHIWFVEWLLANGFIVSGSGPGVEEFAKPLTSGDSLYVQVTFDDTGTHKVSIHSDAPNWASSTGLEIPFSNLHAKLLLWFHGLSDT